MTATSHECHGTRAPADHAEVFALRTGSAASIEVMRTAFRRQVFPRHTHDYLTFGVMLRGGGVIWYRGANRRTRTGDVVVIAPGEVHTGGVDRRCVDRFVSYLAVHVPADTVAACAEAEGLRGGELPDFRSLAVRDRAISRQLRRLDAIVQRAVGDSASVPPHAHVPTAEDDAIADEALTTGLALLVRRHAGGRRSSTAAALPCREPRVVRLAREIIDDCYADNTQTSLRALAECIGVTPFHLVREFTHSVGLSPHRYVVQTRVRRAGELLAHGVPPSLVAAMTGFVDQSHLTMQFKRYVGTTPACYQRCLV